MPHLAPLHGHKVDRQHHIVLATNPHLDLGFMVNGLGFFVVVGSARHAPAPRVYTHKNRWSTTHSTHLEVTRIETTAT